MNNLKKHIPLLVCWVINAIVILLISYIYTNNVVLGNAWINSFYAAFWVAFLITALNHLAKHINKMVLHNDGKLRRFFYYSITNIVFFWLLARLPELSGFGIASYLYAVLLGITLSLVQWATRQGLKKYKSI